MEIELNLEVSASVLVGVGLILIRNHEVVDDPLRGSLLILGIVLVGAFFDGFLASKEDETVASVLLHSQ